MRRLPSHELMQKALQARTVIPAFNIPYLPMIEPVVQALRDCNCFGFIAVARLEFVKFQAQSMRAVRDEYEKFKDEQFTRLHMDHVPVIDEDAVVIDYVTELTEAVALGYDSVMVDGSRLSLADNIAATKKIVDVAHARNVAVEAELGAVMGHGAGPLPSYDELFDSGQGFTDPDEAQCFVAETGTDWLSVAVGSIHGAISAVHKHEKKVAARLNIEQLDRIYQRTNIPLVLHGGTGIQKQYILAAIKRGMAKINIATAIRQPYEQAGTRSIAAAQQAAYEATRSVIRDDLEIENTAPIINPPAGNGQNPNPATNPGETL